MIRPWIPFVLLLPLATCYHAEATDPQPHPTVRYCKNQFTGEITIVSIHFPCPYPTVQVGTD